MPRKNRIKHYLSYISLILLHNCLCVFRTIFFKENDKQMLIWEKLNIRLHLYLFFKMKFKQKNCFEFLSIVPKLRKIQFCEKICKVLQDIAPDCLTGNNV